MPEHAQPLAPGSRKTEKLAEFYRLLHARGMTVEKLAELVARSRGQVTKVLQGKASGRFIWPHLRKHLTEAELCLVAPSSTGNTAPVPRPGAPICMGGNTP